MNRTSINHPLLLMIIILISSFINLVKFSPMIPVSGQSDISQADENSEVYPYIRVIEETDDSIILEFLPPFPQINAQRINGYLCESVSIDGLALLEEQGELMLPIQEAVLGIPEDSKPDISIISVESIILDNVQNLCPSTEPIFSEDASGRLQLIGYDYNGGLVESLIKSEVGDVAQLVSNGYIRSQHYTQIRFNPVQYDPVVGKFVFHNQIQVKIYFNGNSNSTQLAGEILADPYFEDSLKSVLINYEQAKTWRKQIDVVPEIERDVLGSQPVYKILVDKDGLYQVTYTDLLAAGILGETLDVLDPHTFTLINQDNEVAVFVEGEDDFSFDEGDAILFYGQKIDTKFTDTNVYWLTWGGENGLRMAMEDGTPSGTADLAQEFLTNLHVEADQKYKSDAPSGLNNDHWYWNFPYSGPFEVSFNLRNLSIDEHTATLRGLIKSYKSSANPHIRVYINGNETPIFDWYLTNSLEYNFQAMFDQSLLVEGANTLRIEVVSDDDLLFNWVELDYFDSYTADSDRFYFDTDEGGLQEVLVDGFNTSDIQIYDLTDPLLPVRIINPTIESVSIGFYVRFEVETLGEHHYFALTNAERQSPEIIEDTPSNLKSTSNSADYIIISHADFLEEVEGVQGIYDLAELRQSQGMRVQVVDVQEIYDEFNGGVFNPEAIRGFLAYAYEYWISPKPSFILLIGDGNYDFKNLKNTGEPNYIPPYLVDVDTWLGETTADNRYVCVSGEDILPDMYIGRFPVQTLEQAQIMAAKAINYEQNTPIGGWNGKLTFIADEADLGGDYPFESDNLIAYMPSAYTSQKIYYKENYATSTDVKSAILGAFNEGRLIVNYYGHGSVIRWGTDNLFQAADLGSLMNVDKLPFVMPMTCAEGYFIWPGLQSLGESIVRMPGGGAVASWSPTGYGLTAGHAILATHLFNNLFNNNQSQLGILTTQAKYSLATNLDLIDTYILFGDPALTLQTQSAPTAINISNQSVEENQPLGTLVGMLSSEDPDEGENFTYSLISGEGDAGNLFFQLNGDQLLTNAIFDHENQEIYSIRVRSTNSKGLWSEQVFMINILNDNENPTLILLSNNSVAENQPVGTLIGTLSTQDPDEGDAFTYSLVSGDGDTGNTFFQIIEDQLLTDAVFDYQSQSYYNISVRSIDVGGLWIEQVFAINILDDNEKPTLILLSNNAVTENQPVGTLIGTLSTQDPDEDDTFTYSLVSGDGDTGNAFFQIIEDKLLTDAVFDYQSQSYYNIRVRSTNSKGLWIERIFSVNILPGAGLLYLPLVIK